MEDKTIERSDRDRKRARDDSEEIDSPVSELTRVDSAGSDLGSTDWKRARVVDSEPRLDSPSPNLSSPEAKRIQDDLLNILDDSDAVTDRDPAIQGLDSVIKSFEEEILVPQEPSVLDLDLGPAGTKSELGYLLEASDDELGLPPSFGSSADDENNVAVADVPAATASSCGFGFGFGEAMALENEMSAYDSFEFGPGVISNSSGHENGNEYVMLGGLFDFAEDRSEPGDASEVLWRPESLPAI